MTRRCECKSAADECGWCAAGISAAEESRLFNDGWTERDLDYAADAAAARDWDARGGVA